MILSLIFMILKIIRIKGLSLMLYPPLNEVLWLSKKLSWNVYVKGLSRSYYAKSVENHFKEELRESVLLIQMSCTSTMWRHVQSVELQMLLSSRNIQSINVQILRVVASYCLFNNIYDSCWQ